ncbi:ornithine cyclodeaminase family protein, partial [Mesorhizobium sp. M2D.F.Ca.ET.145.01.1.1]
LPETMRRFDRIVVDDLEQEKNMAKPMVDPGLVVGDLTGLVCGDFVGRESAGETTAFVFRGLAVGDLAVAGLAYERAKVVGTVGR